MDARTFSQWRALRVRLLPMLPIFAVLGGCAELLGLTEDYYDADDASSLGGAVGSGGAASTGGASASGGQGGALPALEDFALPEGKLVYHRFTDAAAGDGEMFIVDFPSGTRSSDLGATYGLCNPLDGTFSPDGKQLAVTAQPWTDPCGPADAALTEIYLLDLENPGQKTQVTENNMVPDVDPQFSPDGTFLIFNRGGHFAEWQLGSGLLDYCAPPPTGSFCYGASGAQSKPVLSADQATICYQEGDQAEADIFCVDRAQFKAGAPLNDGDQAGVDGIRVSAIERSYVYDARPVILGPYLYFQRWVSEANKKKLIARKTLTDLRGQEEQAAFCKNESSSYRDAASLGDDYLLFSSDVNANGKTDLFIGHFEREELLPLDEWLPGLNSLDKYEYGASFWSAP